MKTRRFIAFASWLLVGCSESSGSVGPDQGVEAASSVDAGDSVEFDDAGPQTDVSPQVDRNLYIPFQVERGRNGPPEHETIYVSIDGDLTGPLGHASWSDSEFEENTHTVLRWHYSRDQYWLPAVPFTLEQLTPWWYDWLRPLEAELGLRYGAATGQSVLIFVDQTARCRTECSIRIWYAPFEITDTRMTELLWDESPSLWSYAEMVYRDADRTALTRVQEIHGENGTAIVDVAMLTLVLDGSELTLEYRTRPINLVRFGTSEVPVEPEEAE